MGSRGKHGLSREDWAPQAWMYAKRGNDLPHARLDPDAVRAIRANRHGWPRWKWAQHYGVHVRTIDAIATYRTWRHVE